MAAKKQEKLSYYLSCFYICLSIHQYAYLSVLSYQVQEERESLAAEKQEKLAEKARKQREKEERRIKREQAGHKVRKGWWTNLLSRN